MNKQNKDALGVALLGIDERSCKLLAMFFKGPCQGVAHIVDEANASVDIIDTHFANTEQLIDSSLARTPARAVIVFTAKNTERLNVGNLLYLDKPIKAEEMLAAMAWAKAICNGENKAKPDFSGSQSAMFKQTANTAPKPAFRAGLPDFVAQQTTPGDLAPVSYLAIEQAKTKLVDLTEQQKTAKHLRAVTVEEQNFNEFFGLSPDEDINDIDGHYQAFYDAKNHYQGYVQYAYQTALAKMQALQLNSSIWKPLVILPLSHEVWIDADDGLLREMACTWLDMDSMSVSSIDKDMAKKASAVDKIQDVRSFLWKLALWTSKGRYPKTIDVGSPVYLRQWPDFTRYTVTPHALQITGLLVGRGPETMVNIAHTLKIELRYVYIFISAAHAIGLAGQAKRQVDTLIQATLPDTQPAKKGLLKKLISTLQEK